MWAERARPESVDRAIQIGTAALAQHPSDYDLAWKLARAYYRKGDMAPEKSPERRDLYASAQRYAQAAVKLDPDRVEGHCYYGLITGDYGGTLGIISAATQGIASTFEREVKRAYDIDRDFDHGSPMLGLGRFYFELPWPKRDLDRSRKYLEELKQRHPNVLLGRIYLADTDHALGDDTAARRELQYVLDHDPVPDRAVEEHDIKADAQQRLGSWFGAAAKPTS